MEGNTMKQFLLLCACILFLPAFSFAADSGTCVDAGTKAGAYYYGPDGHKLTGDEVLVLCTHAAGALSVTLSGTTAKEALMKRLSGWYQWRVISYPAGTAPTDNTDLEIAETMTATISLSVLGANGTDFIDATTAKETEFYNTFLGVTRYRMFGEAHPLVISTTNNAVASGAFYLLFQRVP